MQMGAIPQMGKQSKSKNPAYSGGNSRPGPLAAQFPSPVSRQQPMSVPKGLPPQNGAGNGRVFPGRTEMGKEKGSLTNNFWVRSPGIGGMENKKEKEFKPKGRKCQCNGEVGNKVGLGPGQPSTKATPGSWPFPTVSRRESKAKAIVFLLPCFLASLFLFRPMPSIRWQSRRR
jgi:hypothetical protein